MRFIDLKIFEADSIKDFVGWTYNKINQISIILDISVGLKSPIMD